MVKALDKAAIIADVRLVAKSGGKSGDYRAPEPQRREPFRPRVATRAVASRSQPNVLMGEVAPDTEYQSREDRAAGRPVRQRIDEATGKRQWKATVTDPDERNAKRIVCTAKRGMHPLPVRALGARLGGVDEET